ncbi:hypothetical protein Ahy_A08g040562 isoform B [Arachis hypogaea]|uniref:BZIP domain-containing protein n=1 Tax=Arachis hypogaea TaxID=3818 RepID=A0A445C083_ARAHY|nr:hypothetical protein Ahy_A08g040562 isoform B [Arachis hypogaea]
MVATSFVGALVYAIAAVFAIQLLFQLNCQLLLIKGLLTNQPEPNRLQLKKVQSSSPVTILVGNTDNQEEPAMADASPRTDISTDVDTDDKNQRSDRGALVPVASDSSDRSKDKTDQKSLRRLAQNREAARKSRLRKKAYVQQLESSRLKLTQLEQELQRARQQGIFISSSGDQAHSMSGNVHQDNNYNK